MQFSRTNLNSGKNANISQNCTVYDFRAKLDYCMKRSTSGDEHDAERKEYIWTVYMCTVFRLMINSCKIMQDSKSHSITQTIHTNLVDLICDAGYQGTDDSKNLRRETLYICDYEYVNISSFAVLGIKLWLGEDGDLNRNDPLYSFKFI